MKKILSGLIFILMSTSFLAHPLSDKYNMDTYYVIGNNLNVRIKPSVESKILKQLKIGSRVRVIRESNMMYKGGYWVYVDTGLLIYNEKINNYVNLKGWVVNTYIAHPTKFVKVTELYDATLVGYLGDYYLHYEFKKDGTVEKVYYNSRNNSKKRIAGNLYHNSDVYIALTEDGGTLIFIEIDGKLCEGSTWDNRKHRICTPVVKTDAKR